MELDLSRFRVLRLLREGIKDADQTILAQTYGCEVDRPNATELFDAELRQLIREAKAEAYEAAGNFAAFSQCASNVVEWCDERATQLREGRDDG